MEDHNEKILPESGASPQRKTRKKRDEPSVVLTPSKLRTFIKPSSRGDGGFAATATKRRGEILDKGDRVGPSSGGSSEQHPAVPGYQPFMPAPSTDDSFHFLGDKLGGNGNFVCENPVRTSLNDSKFSAASPKTPGSSRTEARDTPSAATDKDAINDIFTPEPHPNNDSPSVGRLSTVHQELLKDGMRELDEVAKKISVNTGLTVPQYMVFVHLDLANNFSKSGFVLHNYPEGVPFPTKCDKKKGIACLSVKEQNLLVNAFRHSEYPMKLVKTFTGEVPKNQPVMIGAPPPDTSEHTQGRRLFLEASRGEDRMGPMRQAKKDTQTSVGAEDVPTDQKGKQNIRTRSLSVNSNEEDEDVTSSEDESLCHDDGSPILSIKTRRTGAASNSKPFQKTSNGNEPRSPITTSPLQRKTPITLSKAAPDYRPHPDFFSHVMGQLPPPPIPARPPNGVPTATTYPLRLAPPVYPPRPGPTAGYYHSGPPAHPSDYYAARPTLSYPQQYYQMPGPYQQPQIGTGPPPMPNYSALHQQSTQRRDDHGQQSGYQVDTVTKLEN
ncbi:hypothetical protein HYPSUDRAFT_202495 [Hypholoma sublateritium FD-334 SS-4]|uniref:Uncharacterized protein n=1 Tax=Hypholoma sublateritium (strain FD-334 SS-4) TaxID=945553 RepID=A0A0D2MEI0_HYPSF|nr:hypothetical protein HYPSUDRAFT_202495 [Hypholoma sublateritium FD-334 SS-4]